MVKKILIGFCGALLILLLIGSISEIVISKMEASKGKYPGKMIELKGRDMHLYIEGEGESSIVLVPGLGTPSPYIDFEPLWSRLSKDNKIIVVERFGYGHSEPSETERNFENIVAEMDEALKLSGEKGPYTLLGHSMGGSICIAYAQKYPEKVDNIIMLDAPVPGAYKNWDMPEDSMSTIIPVFRSIGLLRALSLNEGLMNSIRSESNNYKYVSEELLDSHRKLLVKNLYNNAMKGEVENLKVNINHILDKGLPFEKPTLFISTSYLYNLIPDSKSSQEEYMNNSIRTKLLEYDGKHYIHHYYPDEISDEINDFIN